MNGLLWIIDVILTGTITLGESGLKNFGDEGLTLPKASELEPHHSAEMHSADCLPPADIAVFFYLKYHRKQQQLHRCFHMREAVETEQTHFDQKTLFRLRDILLHLFVAASHQTRLDTRSKARRPIKVGIKGRGGRERAETRTLLVCAANRLT